MHGVGEQSNRKFDLKNKMLLKNCHIPKRQKYCITNYFHIKITSNSEFFSNYSTYVTRYIGIAD